MDLTELSERYWLKSNEASPTTATVRGVHEYDSELPSFDEHWVADMTSAFRDIRDRALALDELDMTTQERVTKSLLVHQCESALVTLETPFLLASIDPFTGAHTRLLNDTRLNTVASRSQADDLLERYAKVPIYLEGALRVHRRCVDQGMAPAEASVERVLQQLDRYLASSLEDDPFLELRVPEDHDRWYAKARRLVTDVVRPALGTYREALVEHIAPSARADDRAGLLWVEGGEEIYESLIGRYTQLDTTPDEIHRIGLEWATEINAEEWVQIGSEAFGLEDRRAILERLQADPNLRFESEQQMLAHGRTALERAWESVDDWFAHRPATPCNVVPVPTPIAPAMPPGYYSPPPIDGSRPGTYYLNTYKPGERRLYEYESIHFHEGIPGHHFDRSLAAELEGIATFRRYAAVYAHTEGWGLYSERLAEEMGLYTGPTDRLGMISADAWRAGRLVVDTGIHSLGWTRDEAIAFLAEWSPKGRLVLEQEVDRYIGMPGQALSYKMGQLEILRLRDMARSALGSRFDVKGFHDTMLINGAMTLPMLSTVVEEWLASMS